MSTPGSRPPVQASRKLVLRRKAPAELGSQAAPIPEERHAVTAEGATPPAAPPTLLPRAFRSIEHSPDFDATPRPPTTADSGVGSRPTSSGSRAAALLTPRSGATPLPLPSRISVPPVVASLPIEADTTPRLPQMPPAKERRLLMGALVVGVAAFVGGGVLYGRRQHVHSPPPEAAAAHEIAPPPPAAAAGVAPQPPANASDRVTSVEDLPRVRAPIHPPIVHPVRSPTAAGSASKALADTPAQGSEAPASSAAAGDQSADSASAKPAEVDLPNAPPPPPDPLIRAVQQSIDDNHGN
jgi:hypothetical protein